MKTYGENPPEPTASRPAPPPRPPDPPLRRARPPGEDDGNTDDGKALVDRWRRPFPPPPSPGRRIRSWEGILADELEANETAADSKKRRRSRDLTWSAVLVLIFVVAMGLIAGVTCVTAANGAESNNAPPTPSLKRPHHSLGTGLNEQTILYDDFCRRLSALPDSRFPIYSWPWNERYLLDPTHEKCKRELVRVTGAVGVWLSAPEPIWDAAVSLDPPAISILVTPYYRGWGPERWSRPPSNDPALIDQSVLDYASGFRTACVAAAGQVGGAQVVILLDREGGWPKTDLVALKLNLLVAIARDVFPRAQVAFYNYGQSRNGVSISPVPLSVESDFFGCSLYYAPLSRENDRRFRGTIEAAGDKSVLPWVSLGARWRLHKGKGRTWCPKCMTDLADTWRVGYELSRNRKVVGVVMWPGPFHVPGWAESFLSFCEGVHNIRGGSK